MVSESSFLRIEKKGVDVNREDKQRVVEELHTVWSQANTGVVAHYRGLSVAKMGELRGSLRAAKVSLQVVKNTLARRAAEGTIFSLAEDLFTGPTAIAYGNDPVGLAKALSDFAKGNEALQILGGLQSPLSGFVRTLNEVPASFVRTLAAIRDQKQAA